MKRIPIFVLLAFFCLPLHFSAAQEGGDAVPAGEEASVVPAASVPLEPFPVPEGEAALQEEPLQETTSQEAAPEEPAETAEGEAVTEELEEALAEGQKIVQFARKLGIALAVIAGQILLIWLVWQLFKRLSKKSIGLEGEKIKPLTIKKIRLLTAKQIIDIIQLMLRRGLKWWQEII